MKRKVLINIQGVYRFEDQEDDVVELFTNGTFQRQGDNFYITYTESDATGYEGCETTLYVENNHRITLTRQGPTETHLVVQNGVRHQGLYDIGYGDMMIGVSGIDIDTNLHDEGGKVMFKYALDVNSIMASENKMTIEIKERESDDSQ